MLGFVEDIKQVSFIISHYPVINLHCLCSKTDRNLRWSIKMLCRTSFSLIRECWTTFPFVEPWKMFAER